MDERNCAGTIAFGMEALASEPDLLVLGEMGIGNTTAAAAIFHALYGGEAEDWVGRGTGVDDDGLKRKAEAVRAAVAFHKAHLTDPLEVLARLGGREIAAMAGAIVAARLRRTPVVLDGFVVCAAAAVLQALDRTALDHCLAGHVSAERAHREALNRMGKTADPRPRHAPRRGLRRRARGRRDQGRRRLPQRHGDLRRGRGGGQGRGRNRRLILAFRRHPLQCSKGGQAMANDRNWSAVDDYLAETTVAQDHALEAALADTEAAGLPSIEVSPTHGKMLHLLARIAGARNALEIGALGGYSTIWIARALPAGGKLVTLEANERHASVARANITRAGLADRVEIRVGAALDSLPKIEAEGLAPFDFVFIDADKENNANYVAWALRLSRPGTTVVVDNVVRDGRILDARSRDRDVAGVRKMFEMMKSEPRLVATAVQTVGAKGWDGFALAVVA